MGGRHFCLFEWMSMDFVLDTFSRRPLFQSHLYAYSRAFVSAMDMSVVEWPAKRMVVSSANRMVATP